MDIRAEKLAKARKKLRDHQEKKIIFPPKEDAPPKEDVSDNINSPENNVHYNDSIDNIKSQDPLTNNETTTVANIELNLNHKADVNVTEFLISDKTILEMQIKDLNTKLMQLEYLYESETKENQILKDNVNTLKSDLNNVTKQLSVVSDENAYKETIIDKFKNINNGMNEDKNNLLEQLEVTKVMLKTKESENIRLQNEIHSCHSQLETATLQIQQLTNDSSIPINDAPKNSYEVEELNKKVSALLQMIDTLQKEKDYVTSEYEDYVKQLNEELKNETAYKEKHYKEVQRLSQRENSLIEQMGDMEIRLQSFSNIRQNSFESHNVKLAELKENYKKSEAQLEEARKNYNILQQQYHDSLVTIKSLSEAREQESNHDNISMSKLNADITSDKVAVQRATEQNKKLKLDIEDLELVVVKMTKDKLDLTEMLNHEKNLNKDLILKLTEIEESTKNMNNKLRAKDDEMMRLQSGYRDIENKHGKLLQDLSSIKDKTSIICHDDEISNNNNIVNDTTTSKEQSPDLSVDSVNVQTEIDNNEFIPKNDAMHKLQERFLKIMNEVANLSDEKHRLEHIILQLQNETDTICEYVALYQQQRSLLKKREEERNHQISLFQKECVQLKQHIEELRYIVLQILEDPKLTTYFKNEGIEMDIIRAKHLLDVLQNNSLVEAKFDRLDLNIFYPCNCCSGQLIDV